MKKIKAIVALLLCAATVVSFSACQKGADTSEDTTATDTAADTSAAGSYDVTSFNYSEGLDENGYWSAVDAKLVTTLCEYKGISVPSETHTITDESVDESVSSLVSSFSTTDKVTDRAVADGDTVNIDYVGSVDGVEFEGGNTGGSGTDVTIGVTSYIDDFLEQLIGHTPGETFNVEVTFPDPYQNNTDLSGKDAVFVTTINYISVTTEPEITDAFVAEKLAADYGWTTVAEMRDSLRADLKDTAIMNYVKTFVNDNCTVDSVPDSMIEYQKNSMLYYYTSYASQYSMSLDDFLQSYSGTTAEALISQYAENFENTAKQYIIIQAIAETENIAASEDSVKEFLKATITDYDEANYDTVVSTYGMPFLMMSALDEQVCDFIAENAVLAD